MRNGQFRGSIFDISRSKFELYSLDLLEKDINKKIQQNQVVASVE